MSPRYLTRPVGQRAVSPVLRRVAGGVLFSAALTGLAGAALPARAGKPLRVVPVTPAEPQPLTPEKDEQLLRAVCRYLRLSRAQAINLLPIARWAERGASLFAKEEAEKLRELERIGDVNPVLSDRIKHDLEERRAQLRTQTIRTAGPQLTRILTREQIALLWRLQQGNPPKYARADATLTEPSARFFGSGRLHIGADGIQLGGSVDEYLIRSGIARLTELSIAERLSAEAAAAQAREARMQDALLGRTLRPAPEAGGLRLPDRPLKSRSRSWSRRHRSWRSCSRSWSRLRSGCSPASGGCRCWRGW